MIEIYILFLDFSLRSLFFHSTKSNLFPPAVLADVSGIRHAPALQMPLLDAANDVDAQLPILLERVLPVRGDGIAQGQVSRDAVDHHLTHQIVLARVGVDVLHPPQARVGLVVVVEGAHRLDDVVAQLGDLKLLAEEVEVQEGPDVLFGLGVAQGARVEPADKELEGEVVRVGEAVGFVLALAVLFAVEEVAEEGGVVAQELLVERPAGVVGAHVDGHEGGAEESGMDQVRALMRCWRQRGRYSWRGLSGCSEVVDIVEN